MLETALQPKIQEAWQRLPHTEAQNVNETERLTSVASGGILALVGLLRRGPAGLGALCVSGYLLYRGLTGRCPLYAALDISTADQTAPQPAEADPTHQPSASRTIQRGDIVDETAWATFPASDPPAWTTGRRA